ncbi:hypothetical protein DFJ73DRAFT_763398 [Zopfochytrium polystomum]|nr:hypothetical protein DFJ73DRAFT_763398 [Zopfochytrium polystomum]
MANATSAKVMQTTNWNQQKVLGGRMRSSTEDGGGAAQGLNGIELCSSSVVMAQPNLCADPEPSRGAAVIAISPLKEKVLRPASGREWGALGESQTHDLRMTEWRSTCATSGTWLEDSPHATQSRCKFYPVHPTINPPLQYFTRHAPWILTQVPALEAGNVKPPLNQSHLDLLHALSGIGVRISYFSWQTMERGAPGQSLWRTGRDKVWGLTAGREEAALCVAAIKQDAMPKPGTEVVCGSVQYQAAAAHPGLELPASGTVIALVAHKVVWVAASWVQLAPKHQNAAALADVGGLAKVSLYATRAEIKHTYQIFILPGNPPISEQKKKNKLISASSDLGLCFSGPDAAGALYFILQKILGMGLG